MKRKIIAGLGLVAGVLAFAAPVSAHTPKISISCHGITVGGTAYNHHDTVTLTVNGVAQGPLEAGRDGAFSLHADFNAYGNNTWSYVIDSSDNEYDRSDSGVTEGCSGPTTTTSSTSTSTTSSSTSTTTSTTIKETTTSSSTPDSSSSTSTTSTTGEPTSTSAVTTTTRATTTAPSTSEPMTSTSTAPPSTDCEGICGPGTVETTPPLPDDCIAGTTRWTMLPCDWPVTTTTAVPADVELPATGIDWFYVLPVALVIAGAGTALVVVARRPRDPDERL